MAQDGFQRLAQRVQTRIRRERSPGVFDATPQDFDQGSCRRIRAQIFDDQALLLPGREALGKVVTRRERRLVDDHDGLLRDRVTKRLNTGHHHACVSGCFKHRGLPIIVAMHQPPHIDPPLLPGRQLDDALWLLPGIGHRGIKRKARFITVIAIQLALVCLGLQGCKCTLTFGKCFRISETFS
jgi:hypothetical protein